MGLVPQPQCPSRQRNCGGQPPRPIGQPHRRLNRDHGNRPKERRPPQRPAQVENRVERRRAGHHLRRNEQHRQQHLQDDQGRRADRQSVQPRGRSDRRERSESEQKRINLREDNVHRDLTRVSRIERPFVAEHAKKQTRHGIGRQSRRDQVPPSPTQRFPNHRHRNRSHTSLANRRAALSPNTVNLLAVLWVPRPRLGVGVSLNFKRERQTGSHAHAKPWGVAPAPENDRAPHFSLPCSLVLVAPLAIPVPRQRQRCRRQWRDGKREYAGGPARNDDRVSETKDGCDHRGEKAPHTRRSQKSPRARGG